VREATEPRPARGGGRASPVPPGAGDAPPPPLAGRGCNLQL
jgi:hypothetical protein